MNIHIKQPSGLIFNWTPEAISRAASLWNEGHSASQIAATIGVSRSAVSGLAHRNRDLFKSKQKVGTPDSRQRYAAAKEKITPNRNTGFFRRPERDGVPAEEDALIIEAQPEPTSYDAERLAVAKELHELGRCECHWPLNSGGPFRFCAAETSGKTYCAPHARRARPKVAG